MKYQHVSKGKHREAETRQTADWQGLPTLRRVCGTGGAGQSCTVFTWTFTVWWADKISFLLTKSALAGHVQLTRCFWTIYSKHQKRQSLDIVTTGSGTLHPALHGEVGCKDAEQRCESAEKAILFVLGLLFRVAVIWNHEHDSGRQNTCQRLVRQLPSLQSLLGRQCFLDGVTAHSYVKRKIHAPDMQIISGPDKKRNCEHDESQLHIQHGGWLQHK